MKSIFTPLVIGTLIAAAVNSALYFVATELLGHELFVDPDGVGANPGLAVSALAPAMLTVFFTIIGGVVVAAIALATKNPRNSWRFLTLVGLALSFAPTGFASVGVGSTFLWLSAMHVVAGAVVIPLVDRVLPEEKTPEADTDTAASDLPAGDDA